MISLRQSRVLRHSHDRCKVATHFRKGQKDTTTQIADKDPARAIAHIESEEQVNVEHNRHQGPNQPPEPSPESAEVATSAKDDNRRDAPICGDKEATANDTSLRRWSRRQKPTRRLIESAEQARAIATNPRAYQAIVAHNTPLTMHDGNNYDSNVFHGTEEYEIHRQMADPIAFAASSDPDIMYHHKAMKGICPGHGGQSNYSIKAGHWKIIPISEQVRRAQKSFQLSWSFNKRGRFCLGKSISGKQD